MDKKYVGFITRHGILHLYEDAKDLMEWDFDWVDGTKYHIKDTSIYPEGTK